MSSIARSQGVVKDGSGTCSGHQAHERAGGRVSWVPSAARRAQEALACPKRHISARLLASGTVVKLQASGFRSRPSRHVNVRRGKVQGWSRKSRRRLLLRVCEIEWSTIPREQLYHVGLTYPQEVFPDGRKLKRDFQAFRRRLDRLFRSYGLGWKLEFQRRGYPEFNCVLRILDVPEEWQERFPGLSLRSQAFLFLLRHWVARSWYEVVGSGLEKHLRAGTEVSRPKARESRNMGLYMAKYMHKGGSKEYQHNLPDGYEPGRWWGFVHPEMFPVHWESIEVPLGQFHAVRRVLRRFVSRPGRRYRPAVWSYYSGVTVLGRWDKVLFCDLCRLLSAGQGVAVGFTT